MNIFLQYIQKHFSSQLHIVPLQGCWHSHCFNVIFLSTPLVFSWVHPLVPDVRYTSHTVWCSKYRMSGTYDSHLMVSCHSSPLNSNFLYITSTFNCINKGLILRYQVSIHNKLHILRKGLLTPQWTSMVEDRIF